MYLGYRSDGYRGVIALHAAGMLFLALLLLRSIRREARASVAVVVGVMSLVGVFRASAERPQLVSWCLLAVVVPLLLRDAHARRPPWWLIPVIAVWANLHGLWSAALVLYGCLTLGVVIEVGVRRWSRYRSFLFVGILSFAAASLTPNGPALLLTPLHVRGYAHLVSEWVPPNLLSPFTGMAFLLLAIVVLGWARNPVPTSPIDLCLVAGAAFVGLSYSRTIPVLVIVAAPLAAAALERLLGEPTGSPARPVHTRIHVFLSAAVVLAFVAASAVWLPRLPPVARKAPWEASNVLDRLPGRAFVLNEYTLGGWLLWTARDTSPAVDGRTEIFSADYVQRAMGAPRLRAGWQGFLARHDFDAALLFRKSPLVDALRSRGWKVAHRDPVTIVLVPTTGTVSASSRPG
jgi:hypothetical protein